MAISNGALDCGGGNGYGVLEDEENNHFSCPIPSVTTRFTYRCFIVGRCELQLSFNSNIPVWAESDDRKEEDDGVVGAIKSLFDPNEKTKSGKVLPYVKSAREVVRMLCESLQEDPEDVAKFRRTADSAKESIRDYLSNWRGQEKVAHEESYIELEKAIRSLASFYSKAGPSAPLAEEIKNEILNDNTAEEFL
ncbi:hypothetical protein V6N13_105617 [Hibiscus sabdariffa]